MIRLGIITLSILVTQISCSKDHHVSFTTTTPPVVPVIDSATITDSTHAESYLALGDSYTIGQSVPVTDQFPVQTTTLLASHGIKFSSPEIIAQTGWTTADLLGKLALKAPVNTKYDIVTLLIGVNNQYQHRSQKEYTDQFQELLNKAISYADNNKNRVVVLSIPDYSVTPYASNSNKDLIAKQIDSFNIINKAISNLAGVNYLDITGFSRRAANDASLIATDGLHPSGLEYKVWAEALVPVIRNVLQ